MIFQLCVSIPVMRAVWRSQLHRNVIWKNCLIQRCKFQLRLRISLCILHAILFNLVRLYVIYEQVFGPSERGEIESSRRLTHIYHELFSGYYGDNSMQFDTRGIHYVHKCTFAVHRNWSLFCIQVLELVNLLAYAIQLLWSSLRRYDRGGIPTTIFFIAMEAIHLCSTYFASYRIVYGNLYSNMALDWHWSD